LSYNRKIEDDPVGVNKKKCRWHFFKGELKKNIPLVEAQQSNLIFQARETKKFYFNFRTPHQNDDVEICISFVTNG